MREIKWTAEAIAAEAAKHKTRNQFRRAAPSAHHAASRRGILDEVCSHMVPTQRRWTKEQIHSAALLFKSRSDFKRGEPAAFAAAQNRGIMDEVCSHMQKPYSAWSDEELLAEAEKYTSRRELNRLCSGVYRQVWLRGIQDKAYAHIPPAPTGFRTKNPATFYILRIVGVSSEFIGFGITNDMKSRMRTHAKRAARSGFSLELVDQHHFQSGFDALSIETSVKRRFETIRGPFEGFLNETVNAKDEAALRRFVAYLVAGGGNQRCNQYFPRLERTQ